MTQGPNPQIVKNEVRKSSFVQYMANPRAFTLKKWFYELLKEKYPQYEVIIERVGISMVTDHDLEEFGKLVMDVFTTGYLKAVNDYKDQAEKLGFKIKVSDPKTNETT